MTSTACPLSWEARLLFPPQTLQGGRASTSESPAPGLGPASATLAHTLAPSSPALRSAPRPQSRVRGLGAPPCVRLRNCTFSPRPKARDQGRGGYPGSVRAEAETEVRTLRWRRSQGSVRGSRSENEESATVTSPRSWKNQSIGNRNKQIRWQTRHVWTPVSFLGLDHRLG